MIDETSAPPRGTKGEPDLPEPARGPSDYERLVRFLAKASGGFGLAIARCTSDVVRDRVVLRATVDAEAAGVRVATLDLREHGDEADLLELLASAANQPSTNSLRGVLVIGLDRLVLDAKGRARSTPAIEGLNRRRDLLPAAVPARTIFLVSDSGADALSQVARDLHDVALTFFRFDAEEYPPAITRYNSVPEWIHLAQPKDEARLRREMSLLEHVHRETTADSLPTAEAAARIGQIKVLLGAPAEGAEWLARAAAAFDRLADWRNEAEVRVRLGDVLVLLGDAQTALAEYRVAANRSARAGDFRNRAVVLGREADVLEGQGQWDEALRIRREEQLPVYERLGDVRARAVTMGKIADVLQQRGQTDEALRIRREEELPVYERLGDVRARAVTMGQIADVLQQRGQTDEALRIHLEERLPVAQRMGDLDSVAHARFMCALIRLERGGLEGDEAATILEEVKESFALFSRLQRADAIAMVGLTLGGLLAVDGDASGALAVLDQAAAAAERIQHPELLQQIRELQATIRSRAKASATDS